MLAPKTHQLEWSVERRWQGLHTRLQTPHAKRPHLLNPVALNSSSGLVVSTRSPKLTSSRTRGLLVARYLSKGRMDGWGRNVAGQAGGAGWAGMISHVPAGLVSSTAEWFLGIQIVRRCTV